MRGQSRILYLKVKVQTVDTCDVVEGASVREKGKSRRENSGKPAAETKNQSSVREVWGGIALRGGVSVWRPGE